MRVRIVDAFTDRAFAGNPAGVCVLDAGDWPAGEWMQQLAAELNLPMTAFARPQGDGAWGLRWFTPRIEERLCGHATLATAFVLDGEGAAGGSMTFDTLGGELRASVGAGGLVTLDFPAADVRARGPVEGLADALGAEPDEVLESAVPHDLIAVLGDEAAVRDLGPQLDLVAAIQHRDRVRLVIVTAPGADHDFVSRVFSPADGIPEDPVTGSAHCALAPFWAQRLGGTELVGYQASVRGGLVRTELAGDRVLLSGRATLVFDGELSAAALSG